MIEKIKKINKITGNNIEFFVNNIQKLKNVVFKKENEEKKKRD
jgi:hypothetical protein